MATCEGKARLVAKGYSRKEGIDFLDMFAPTPSAASIRQLVSVAGEFILDLYIFDAQQASRQWNNTLGFEGK